MMHDFNSVSGTWSHTQLKGRGGQRGDKCKEWRERREKEERSDEEGRRFGGGGALLLAPALAVGFLDGTRAGRERRRRKGKGGGEQSDGGEGPAWLLSASHVSKPVLKNE